MLHFRLNKGTDYHSSFPDIGRIANGDLAVVFREALARPGNGDPEDKWNERRTHYHADREIVIRDDGIHSDLGYPASVQLRDGRVLTVYYFHGEDGIRYIGGSVYDLNG